MVAPRKGKRSGDEGEGFALKCKVSVGLTVRLVDQTCVTHGVFDRGFRALGQSDMWEANVL